jgi:hypothetical protein
MGISMGGYLAARAAAFEHRIAACILYNGVFDGYDALASSLPKSLLTAIENGNREIVNTVIDILMDSDTNIKFNIKHGMWTTGVNSSFELIMNSKYYTIKNIAHNIKCPILVLDAEKEDSFPGQPKRYMMHLHVQRNTFCSHRRKALKSIVNVVLQLFQISGYLIGWMKHLQREIDQPIKRCEYLEKGVKRSIIIVHALTN